MEAVVHTSSTICRERLIRLVLGVLNPARGVIWLTTVNHVEGTKEICSMAERFGVRVVLDFVRETELTLPQMRVFFAVKKLWDQDQEARPCVLASYFGWSLETTASVLAELFALRVLGASERFEA